MEVYPLVNLYITNWKDPPCYENGKIHYFDWAIVKFANCLGVYKTPNFLHEGPTERITKTHEF